MTGIWGIVNVTPDSFSDGGRYLDVDRAVAAGEAWRALGADGRAAILHRAGDVIARIPREGARTKDITGGLPRVAELFEARRPKDHAIIAELDGTVKFGKDYKNKRRIIVQPTNEDLEPVEYMVPKGKHIPVQEGDFVQKGDYIMDGNPAPHDILRIMGIEALADYLLAKIIRRGPVTRAECHEAFGERGRSCDEIPQ